MMAVYEYNFHSMKNKYEYEKINKLFVTNCYCTIIAEYMASATF